MIDEFDSIDDSEELLAEASKLFNKVVLLSQSTETSILVYSQLSRRDIFLLSYYFYKTNHVYRRVTQIKSNVSSSSIQLHKPNHNNELIKDYIHDFFSSSAENSNLIAELRKIIFSVFCFGVGYLLVEDGDEIEDYNPRYEPKKIDNTLIKKAEDIVAKYERSGYVTENEFELVRDVYLQEDANPEYTGILKTKALSVFKIVSESKLLYNGFKTYEIARFTEVDDLIAELKEEFIASDLSQDEDTEMSFIIEKAKDLGYNQGIVQAHLSTDNSDTFTVSNNPEDDLYIVEFYDNQIFDFADLPVTSMLQDMVNFVSGNQQVSNLVRGLSKRLNIVTVEGNELQSITEEDLSDIESKILDALNSDKDAEVVSSTYNLNIDTITFEKLIPSGELNEFIDTLESRLIVASGVPESLLSGEETYGNAFLKIEMLSNELSKFRNDFAKMAEDKILKPQALKKGFVNYNLFGTLDLIHSKIGFEIGSLLNTQDFLDKLADFQSDDLIAKSTLLARYGLDYNQEKRKIAKEEAEDD